MNFTFTPDMGEISGFGGGYEEACQRMLLFGLGWLTEHPPVNHHEVTEPEWEALRNAVGGSEDGCSGAMVGVTSNHALYAYRHGGEAYQTARREAHRKHVEEAPAREAEEKLQREQQKARFLADQAKVDAWAARYGTAGNPEAEEEARLLRWYGLWFHEGEWRAGLGCMVSDTAKDLCVLATVLSKRFEVDFNGHPLYAEPGEAPEAVTARWWALMNAPTTTPETT